MNLSALFIKRPITTTLIMLGIMVFGVMAYRHAAGQPICRPSTSRPFRCQRRCRAPARRRWRRRSPCRSRSSSPTIAGLDQHQLGRARQGSTNITLQFDLDRNIDAAAQDVQSMIARASRSLPPQMPAPPSYQKSNPADQPVILLVLRSPTLPLAMLDEYAEQTIAQRISMVSGVAQVDVFGSQKFAVRIDVDPAPARRAFGRHRRGGRRDRQRERQPADRHDVTAQTRRSWCKPTAS